MQGACDVGHALPLVNSYSEVMDRNTPTRWARQGQTCIYCGKQEFCGSTYLSQNKMCRLYRGALGYWLHIGPYQKYLSLAAKSVSKPSVTLSMNLHFDY